MNNSKKLNGKSSRRVYSRSDRAITLIALIVTIIVLLILAGISISMLSADNGILQRATDAKTKSDEAQIRERIQLAYNSALTKDISNQKAEVEKSTFEDELKVEFPNKTIRIENSADKKEWIVTINGVTENVPIGKDTPKVATLPSSDGTKPYFPSDKFSQVKDTDLNTGLVITDEVDEEGTSIGNEYVWIEVPNKNINKENKISFTGPDYPNTLPEKINEDLNEEQKTIIQTKILEYTETLLPATGSDYNTTKEGWKDEWYDGCGIASSDEYNNLYNNMIKSIYNNGGFWIGRFEAGVIGNTVRVEDNVVPLSKKYLIPICDITCGKAQTIATRVENKGIYNSSLMFGIQWDCVLKYLQNQGLSVSELTTNSKNFGNYTDTSNALLTGGKYTQLMNSNYQNTFDTWYSYDIDLGNIVHNKIYNNTGMPQSVLLTTGSLPINMTKQNIYDFAGNVCEWTLEHAKNDLNKPCAYRGGGFVDSGLCSMSNRRYDKNTGTGNTCGFRVAIY